jgi:L-threonylcarbamoyladenylate synthase
MRNLEAVDASRLEACVASGGVAVFPTDTVYGVCCDAEDERAAERMYRLKGRPPTRPAAVLFFSIEPALAMLGELADAERAALEALLPGPVTVLLANRSGRFAPACRSDPATLGLRVPRLPEHLAALAAVAAPLMQSSANISGEPDARTLEQVPQSIRDGADLVLDGGELAGTPSTVIDLRDLDTGRRWHLLREGALARAAVEELLGPLL